MPARQHKAGGIYSLESVPGLHKRLKIRALARQLHRLAEFIPWSRFLGSFKNTGPFSHAQEREIPNKRCRKVLILINRLLSVVPLPLGVKKKNKRCSVNVDSKKTNLSAESIIFFNIKR
jgi:hypothetical protein